MSLGKFATFAESFFKKVARKEDGPMALKKKGEEAR